MKRFGLFLVSLALLALTGWWAVANLLNGGGPAKQTGSGLAAHSPQSRVDHAVGSPGDTGKPTAPASIARRPHSAQFFGQHGAVGLTDVPTGRFRDELDRLGDPARNFALSKLGDLKIPFSDLASLHVDATGHLYYQCNPRPTVGAAPEARRPDSDSPTPLPPSAASVPIASPPVRHSRLGASKVIYLDFNGHVISGTAWNTGDGIPSYTAKAYDTDNDANTFNDSEQADIIEVWERVAEDFRPFDVDVTTEDPGTFNNNTGRILITDNVDGFGNNMPAADASGVAYIDVFGQAGYASSYSPALVYANKNFDYAPYIAETASHEMGHNLALRHDGTAGGDEYYGGHGSGETSWNTIMGGAFSENVTQWSKGEYYNYTNPEGPQDDLAEIANLLGYVPDDHGDTNGTATALTVNGSSLAATGVISATGEADRFSFTVAASSVSFTVNPYRSSWVGNGATHGGNLDVALELYDSSNNLVTSANPAATTYATLTTSLAAGTYYLRIYGTGTGTPLNNPPTGYTSYGSLGSYSVSGSTTVVEAPAITGHPANQTVSTTQSAQFTVVTTGSPAPGLQWQWLPAGGGSWSNLGNGAGSAGNISGATTATLGVGGATLAMSGNQFRCVATNSVGSATSNPATLSVTAGAPYFTLHPVSQNVATNSTLSLQVAAAGAAPLAYQWQRNEINIPGATAATYTFANVTQSQNGGYRAIVTNSFGSATSTSASINVLDPPTISTHPVSRTTTVGSSVGFTVVADGSGALSYQWYHDGSPITGATSTSLTVTNVQLGSAGNYAVVVSNQIGQATSQAAVLTVSPANGAAISAVSAGESHSLFLRCDGTLWGIGSAPGAGASPPPGPPGSPPFYGHLTPNELASGVTAMLAGRNRSYWITSDGALWAQGIYTSGEFGLGYTGISNVPVQVASNVAAVSAGNNHTLWLKKDGTLWATGDNFYGQLGDGTIHNQRLSPVQIATEVIDLAAGLLSSQFLKRDGSLWATGDGFNTATPVKIAEGVKRIASGHRHSLFIKDDNSLWGRGSYTDGNLGLSIIPSTPQPWLLASNAVSIAGGDMHSLFIGTNGTLWGSGGNQSGALGNGSNTNVTAFIPIATNVTVASAGTGFSIFAKTDGSVWTMGFNNNGQLGNGTTVSQNVPLQITSGSWLLPTVPASVSASDAGTGRRVTWNTSVGAQSYEVWRSSVAFPATASRIATDVRIPLYYDAAGTAGSYYWIKAVNPAGSSDFSVLIQPSISDSLTDFNHDGISDLVWTDTGTGERWLQLMTASGYGARLALTTLGPEWRLAGSGDFNNDGKSDVLWQNTTTGAYYVWFMDGTAYSGYAYITTMATEWRLASSGDFNGDGKSDIVWHNSATNAYYIWLMDGTSYSSYGQLASMAAEWRLAGSGDFNADGKSDILWQNTATGDCYVWFMNGTSYFAYSLLATRSPAWQLVDTGDFNHDNQSDLAWSHAITGERELWLMNGASQSGTVSLGITDRQWVLGWGQPPPATTRTPADFNADGKSDILWQNTQTGDCYVWYMNGTSYSGYAYLTTLPLDWRLAGSGDFNGDGKGDIFWQNTTDGSCYVWYMNGATYSGNAYVTTMAADWRLASTGDFNGDGKTDLVWRNTTSGDYYIWLMDGPAYTAYNYLTTLGSEWRLASTGDFNGDGKADILWQNTATGSCYVWYMDGLAYSSYAYLTTMAANWRLAGSGDFNGDGKADIVWRDLSTGYTYVWLMNGTTLSSYSYLSAMPVPPWHLANGNKD